ncbi:MAG: extracellular solute-binding protein [Betaproteobacteria bacterium]|nr:extracellular solute-binding protein [Betaproteobacteria bacterium]
MKTSRTFLKTCLAAAALLALADGAAIAQTAKVAGFTPNAALLAAAQKEGKVVFWCSLRAEECSLVSGKFEEMTKIKTEFIRVSTGPALTRLSQERGANIHSVDVVSHSDQSVWESVYKKKSWLVKYMPEGVARYAPEYRDQDGFYFAHFLIANGIGYNTKGLTGADVPRSYADLVNPKYKGKLVMPHPGYSGGFTETVAILSKVMGPDYFEKLKKNDVMVKAGSQFTLNPIVAGGERMAALQGTDAMFISDAQQGKPVGIVYPTEGTVVNAMYAGLVVDAPHPNAGKLLLEWIHSPESQTEIASANWLVPHPDAKYPAGRTKLKDIKTLTLSPAEAVDAIPEAKTRFRNLFGG